MINTLDKMQIIFLNEYREPILLVYSVWLWISLLVKVFTDSLKCNLIFKSRNMAQLTSLLIHLFYKALIFFFCLNFYVGQLERQALHLRWIIILFTMSPKY